MATVTILGSGLMDTALRSLLTHNRQPKDVSP